MDEIHRLALKWPRFGYRRITALLRRDGWRVNVKRVHRLWKAEGLQIRRKARNAGDWATVTMPATDAIHNTRTTSGATTS